MKITFYHDVRKATRNELNQYPVMIRVANNSKNSYIATGVTCTTDCFINTPSVVVLSLDGSTAQNQTLLMRKMEIEVAIKEGIKLGRIYPNTDPVVIKEYLVGAKTKKEEATDIAYIWRHVAKQKTNQKTAKILLSTLSIFLKVQKNTDVRNINAEFLRTYVSKAIKHYSGSTIKLVMKYLHQVYVYALENQIIVTTINPFKNLQIPTSKKTEYTTLTKEDFTTLKSFAEKDQTCRQAFNIMCLSLYLCGINLVDLYHLRKKDFKKNKITYIRKKMEDRGGERITITVPDVAKKIMWEYLDSNDSEFLLNFHDTAYDSLYQRINYQMKRLSALSGIKVTTYTARYTWATTAFTLGVQEAVIDLGLGHRKRSEAMRSYVKPNYQLVDEANAKVLAYFLE